MLVTDTPEGREPAIREAIAGGVNLVQVRGGDPEDNSRRDALAARLEKTGDALVTVNPWSAPPVPAPGCGIHLPETRLAEAADLRQRYPALLVGVSVHSPEAAERAAAAGANYLVAGHIYDTASHPGEPGRGIGYLREVCLAAPECAVLAIGGITPERVGECLGAGAAGVAVLSALLKAENPREAATRYHQAIKEYREKL